MNFFPEYLITVVNIQWNNSHQKVGRAVERYKRLGQCHSKKSNGITLAAGRNSDPRFCTASFAGFPIACKNHTDRFNSKVRISL